MSNEKMKTQSDILSEANDTLKKLNRIIEDPEAYRQAKKKIDLKKIKKSQLRRKDDGDFSR